MELTSDGWYKFYLNGKLIVNGNVGDSGEVFANTASHGIIHKEAV